MSAHEEPRWIEPYEGLVYAQRSLTVEADEQDRLLRLCGLDPSVFGETIDPAAFITLAIQEGVRNRIHANGTVNLGQRLIQHRPLKLGEPLTVHGRILSVQPVPRGHVAVSETWYCGEDGQRAMTTGRHSLRPGPAMTEAKGAGERPEPVIADPTRLARLGSATLTPEGVIAYTGPENPIHTVPEAARAKGFRAPIIGGGQGVRFLTHALWRRFSPRTLSLDIRFRRPVFWDDTVEVVADEHEGRWRAIGLVVGGKVCTEARIDALDD